MKPESEQQTISDLHITVLLKDMRLEEAIRTLKSGSGEIDSAAVKAMIVEYETRASRMRAAGEIGEAIRLARRAGAPNRLLLHGPDPARLVVETELPEDYVGKVLMMRVTGGAFDDTVILRSGDGWHREILHNTRAEMADLGFPEAEVHPLGGAYAGFDSDGIVIWGNSDEYGCCDKEKASTMIARAFPGKLIRIEN
jgi:hypothetical protein